MQKIRGLMKKKLLTAAFILFNITSTFAADHPAKPRKLNVAEYKTMLPEKCRFENPPFSDIFNCATQTFSIKGSPVNPAIIEEFLGSIEDRSNVAMAFNLINAQDSSRFLHEENSISINKYDNFIEIESLNKEGDGFSYRVEGITKKGYHVLSTKTWSKDGSGIFASLLIVKLEKDQAFNDGDIEKTLLLKNYGQIIIGDRNDFEIEIKGNTLKINSPNSTGEQNSESREIDLSKIY